MQGYSFASLSTVNSFICKESFVLGTFVNITCLYYFLYLISGESSSTYHIRSAAGQACSSRSLAGRRGRQSEEHMSKEHDNEIAHPPVTGVAREVVVTADCACADSWACSRYSSDRTRLKEGKEDDVRDENIVTKRWNRQTDHPVRERSCLDQVNWVSSHPSYPGELVTS